MRNSIFASILGPPFRETTMLVLLPAWGQQDSGYEGCRAEILKPKKLRGWIGLGW